MKNLILTTFILLLFYKPVIAQEEGVGIAAGLVLGAAAIALSIDNIQEQAELSATKWILSNYPNSKSFSLKTQSFDNKKMKDISAASLMTFYYQDYDVETLEYGKGEYLFKKAPNLNGQKKILLAFTSPGWVNDYGVDYSKISWFLIDKEEWLNMMVSYAKVASSEKDENILRNTIIEDGFIANKGIKSNNKKEFLIPFYKLSGDMYLVSDYNDKMKLIYNENSLGIYLKDTQSLIQIKRSTLINTHSFLFD